MITEDKLLEARFGKHSPTANTKVASNLVVMYTRVSGKGQFDKNDSLETQKKAIEEYAARNNLIIVSRFGDTYESAKTDARKEFQRMLDFIRHSKGSLSTILVYKMTRFSRTGGKAISIADELREKHGVHVKAVTEPIDTSNPSGVLFHDMQLLFGRWDNDQRKQVAMAGMKAKFEKGIWVVKPPQGYDIVRSSGERKIVLNDHGKKIKKAWDWKIQGLKNEEIILKLQALGVKMYKQQLHKIFINPFYCGLISHGMLNGKIVDGVHEKMITKEVFMKVNDIVSSSTKYGVPHKLENVHMPLKVFITCSDCRQPFTGYIVKKKNLYYYKCRTNGCKCNKSANTMHDLFANELDKYQIKQDLAAAIQLELENAYYEGNMYSVEKEKELKVRMIELERNIEKLEENYFIKEEMKKETYDRFFAKYREDHKNIQKEMAGCSVSISNLKEMINEATLLCQNLRKIWVDGSISLKEKIQKLIFPSGLVYDKKKGAFRTPELNYIIAEIARLSGDLALMKKGLSSLCKPKSLSAERVGFEPTIPLRVYKLSRLARSATLTPLRFGIANVTKLCKLIFFKDLHINFFFHETANLHINPFHIHTIIVFSKQKSYSNGRWKMS
jgi:site-specific DNA recombinase